MHGIERSQPPKLRIATNNEETTLWCVYKEYH